MKAQLNNRLKNRLSVVLVLFALTAAQALAENTLMLVKTSKSEAVVEFSNVDPVAGIQFTINTKGNVALKSFQSGDRIVAGGWEAYYFLKNDLTLNVIMLAPYRASFSGGKGVIAKISFESNDGAADTNKLFFSRTVLCDVNAKDISFSTVDLVLSAATQDVPLFFSLGQNFPNPFNPSTTLTYKLEQPARVTLVIYDVIGRAIKTLASQYQFQGQYNVKWESVDEQGHKVPSGMYIARLQVENQSVTKKMLLTK
ncbi:MAG: T9SS type A sorting domain-containing protein [Ignavibacteriales bacterium]|nr:T9SS type A sorting domain-containing protein [Ignavibacteriales bacterium]